MAPLHHRDVGLVGMALTDDRLRIELIADGVHVEPRALALAVRSKPAGGWVLVSDGVAAVGQPPGPLRLFAPSVSPATQCARRTAAAWPEAA